MVVRVDGLDQEAMDQKAVSGLSEPLDASFQSMSAGPHTGRDTCRRMHPHVLAWPTFPWGP